MKKQLHWMVLNIVMLLWSLTGSDGNAPSRDGGIDARQCGPNRSGCMILPRGSLELRVFFGSKRG